MVEEPREKAAGAQAPRNISLLMKAFGILRKKTFGSRIEIAFAERYTDNAAMRVAGQYQIEIRAVVNRSKLRTVRQENSEDVAAIGL